MADNLYNSNSDQAARKSRLALQVHSGRKKEEKIEAKKAAAAQKFNDELAVVRRNNVILAQRERRRKRSADLKLNARVRYTLGGLVLNAIHTDGDGVFVVNASTLAVLSDKDRGLLREVLLNISESDSADEIENNRKLTGAATAMDQHPDPTNDLAVRDPAYATQHVDINFDD